MTPGLAKRGRFEKVSVHIYWVRSRPILVLTISPVITPAIKYLNIVIPAKAGIQVGTGCRIKSGMTELDYLIARLILYQFYQYNFTYKLMQVYY